ncbi:MAG TPA: ABC transporter ATP-binding protein [Thermoanaerobaculia bacterium]
MSAERPPGTPSPAPIAPSPSTTSRTASPLLSVENLTVELPAGGALRPALRGVTFPLRAGESVALVGESGCGKTQLARAILGLSPESARVTGAVRFGGRDLLALSDAQWRAVRGREIGLVFQEPASALDPVQTIGAQIQETLRFHFDVSRAEGRRLALAALRDVAFPDPERGLSEYPHRLSGGLRQRALLALTLACGPALLLADEPTASLDATVAAQVLDLLDRLRRERRLTLLLITHDLGAVAAHCDRVLVLYAGQIVEEADTATLFRSPAHPYTRGLLRSMPRVDSAAPERGRRYEVIPGLLAGLASRDAVGCSFAPRCPERFAPCEANAPDLYPTGAGNSVARCFLYGGTDSSASAPAPGGRH